jgi:hypothetical protein
MESKERDGWIEFEKNRSLKAVAEGIDEGGTTAKAFIERITTSTRLCILKGVDWQPNKSSQVPL